MADAPTLRDLLNLAAEENPAEFTSYIQDLLDAKASSAVETVAIEEGFAAYDDEEEELPEIDDEELDDLEVEEDEDLEIEEGRSQMKSDDDDDWRAKGKAKKLGNRSMRRTWKRPKFDDMDESAVSLREDLSDEDLQDLCDNLTDEDFETLDEESQERLLDFLAERNKENAEKGRAWKAGQYLHKNPSSSKVYVSDRDKWDRDWKEKRDIENKKRADFHHKKGEGRVDVAKDRLRKMGGPVRKASHARDAGKAHEPKKDTGNVSLNKSYKDGDTGDRFGSTGLGRGKFLQQHHRNQHEKLRRSMEDMHNEIQRRLSKLRDGASSTGLRAASPDDIARAKAAHDKMAKIHSQLGEGYEPSLELAGEMAEALLEAREVMGG